LSAALSLLRTALRSELAQVGEDKLPEVDRLATGRFDSTVHQATANFLKALKKYYLQKMTKAREAKDEQVNAMTDTPEKLEQFNALRRRYVNATVSDAVRNTTTSDFIVEYDGRLVRRLYPIYQDEHNPRNAFDFSANLYQPTKHFLGYHIDTLYFNLGAIWMMTFCLFVTAYFDVLPRIMHAFERSRKYRRG